MRRKFCRLRKPAPRLRKFAAQVIPGVEEEERRREHPRMKCSGPHTNAAAASGTQESATTPAATPFSSAEDGAHREEHQEREVEHAGDQQIRHGHEQRARWRAEFRRRRKPSRCRSEAGNNRAGRPRPARRVCPISAPGAAMPGTKTIARTSSGMKKPNRQPWAVNFSRTVAASTAMEATRRLPRSRIALIAAAGCSQIFSRSNTKCRIAGVAHDICEPTGGRPLARLGCLSYCIRSAHCR